MHTEIVIDTILDNMMQSIHQCAISRVSNHNCQKTGKLKFMHVIRKTISVLSHEML